MPASTVLVLSSDSKSAEHISRVLTHVGYSVTAIDDPDQALGLLAENHVLVLDHLAGDKTAHDLCREIRSSPALASTPILCVAESDEVEERIRFLESGADDVMARPFDPRELEARVEALLLRFQRAQDLAPVVAGGDTIVLPARAHRIVAVFSPKGGVGTTTIATNLALLRARQKPDRVAIVDMHLQFGQVATHLNLDVKQSLAELVRDEAALREPELLRTYATRHESGLHVFAAPPSLSLADLLEPSHIELILTTILGTYESIVVDAGSTYDERTMVVLEKADSIVLPVYPEMAALRAVRSLIDHLTDNGSALSKTTFVLNDVFARQVLRSRDVEGGLGAKIALELPYDPFLYLKAVNEGVPVVAGAPRSSPADRLNRLAAMVYSDLPAELAQAPERNDRKPRRLGLIRRSRT